MIIDTHIHLYDPMRPQGVPWPDPENKLLYRTTLPVHAKAQSVGEGVSGTVIVEATDWMEDNQWILDLAAEEPFIVGLVGRMDPCRVDFSENLQRFAPHPLFQGIRWRDRPHYDRIDEGSFMKDMETLAAHDLVLDTGIPAAHEEGFFTLLDRLPQLRVMVEHIAGGTVDGKAPDSAWSERMQRAGAYPNVWMKVSALMENSTVQPAPADVDFYRPLLDTLLGRLRGGSPGIRQQLAGLRKGRHLHAGDPDRQSLFRRQKRRGQRKVLLEEFKGFIQVGRALSQGV